MDELVGNVTTLFAERAGLQNIDLAAVIDPDDQGIKMRLSQITAN